MLTFEVKDMICGHCFSTLTKALKAVDKAARVQIELATRRVQIDPVGAEAKEFSQTIQVAGYTPVAIAAPSSVEDSRGSSAQKAAAAGD